MAVKGRKKRSDDVLAIGLARGLSVCAAAKKAGLSERTATRRLADPVFRGRIDGIRSAFLEKALAGLTAGAVLASKTLLQLLKRGRGHVRLGAARLVLEHIVRLRELLDHDERLRRLEEALQIAGSRKPAVAAIAVREDEDWYGNDAHKLIRHAVNGNGTNGTNGKGHS